MIFHIFSISFLPYVFGQQLFKVLRKTDGIHCTRACVCVRTHVCVCHYEKKLLLLPWLFHRECYAVVINPDHAVESFLFVVISDCFTKVFTASYTFFF